MKTKLYLLLSLVAGSMIHAGDAAQLTRISKAAILSPERLSLYHDGEGFHVKQKGRLYAVPRYDTDEVLRKVNKTNLAAYLQAGLIRVSKTNNGEYVLRSHIKGLGGGTIGAYIGCFLGKGLVYGTYYSTVAVIGAVTTPFLTPAGSAVLTATIHSTCAGPVEVFSNYVAIAGGVAGAAATGPV